MSRRHNKCCYQPCCEPCYKPCPEPCCEPCYVPCQTSGVNGGLGGGSLCWIIIAIAIFWIFCKDDRGHCRD